MKHFAAAQTFKYSYCLADRPLRRNLHIQMNVILIHFRGVNFHTVLLAYSPQQSLNLNTLVLLSKQPLAIFSRPDQMVPTVKNAVTTSIKHSHEIYRTRAYEDKGAFQAPL